MEAYNTRVDELNDRLVRMTGELETTYHLGITSKKVWKLRASIKDTKTMIKDLKSLIDEIRASAEAEAESNPEAKMDLNKGVEQALQAKQMIENSLAEITMGYAHAKSSLLKLSQINLLILALVNDMDRE